MQDLELYILGSTTFLWWTGDACLQMIEGGERSMGWEVEMERSGKAHGRRRGVGGTDRWIGSRMSYML